MNEGDLQIYLEKQVKLKISGFRFSQPYEITTCREMIMAGASKRSATANTPQSDEVRSTDARERLSPERVKSTIMEPGDCKVVSCERLCLKLYHVICTQQSLPVRQVLLYTRDVL